LRLLKGTGTPDETNAVANQILFQILIIIRNLAPGFSMNAPLNYGHYMDENGFGVTAF
jgi:hypothetical protein